MSQIMKNDRRAVTGWCMYDWANSAFTTLVVTFIYSTYFTNTFAEDVIAGTSLWSRGITVSAILIALLSPIAGAVADQGGRRKLFLVASTLIMAVATAVLAFITPEIPRGAVIALTIFVVGNVAFEIGMVFYNSFLPDLVTNDRIGRVSGYGWALGYGGGLTCLAVGLVAFVGFDPNPGWLGLDTETGFHVRGTNLLVAVWVVLFAIPMFLWVKEARAERRPLDIGAAFTDLFTTLRNIRQYRDVARFLVARLVYNDGLVTIFAFGAIYASGTFGFTFTDVLIFGIVINVMAGAGAFAFGFFDDKLGGKATVVVSLIALMAAVGVAMWAPSRMWLWVAAVGIGIFAGPNQSASRSLMGRFVPEKHKSEFFGFFAFSGKATAFLGPILFSAGTEMFDSQRAGVASVLVFFLVGGLILLGVDERRGMETAQAN